MANTDNNPVNGAGGSSYMYTQGTTPNTRTVVSQKIRLLTPHYGNNSALHQIGVVASFNYSLSRNVDEVRGLGFGDVIAEIVPGVTDAVTGSFTRALLYLSNIWQAAGYAAGVDGPVRNLSHHRWPFDIEQQLVFSSLADNDMGIGFEGTTGAFDGGVANIAYPQVTPDYGQGVSGGEGVAPSKHMGHSAIITMFEACWFTSGGATFDADSGAVQEDADWTATDVHDFSTMYGEFLATGNDPTIGQLGSLRFQGEGFAIPSQQGGRFVGTHPLSGIVDPNP